ncbi:hypothetical protein M670_00409 [Schinkia azotoformans MEV2011]|uniref:Uncharacterized protein n=1 Tax=Schinkia azotoformans MEV2011 TaxID=1348973 RepID=A0A072NU19_SCHAZ|nr:hypothetical protein [Schinkia azotoformans]KEF40383.1 hypothetical protein M670_00409 [Schinkia azotoformans MEV2011]MEC1696204.1 hypothetical protein [Schinkia azotoformans]MEC1725293.1 hypothetical protein [Schinkia azotoformans]
MYNILYTRMMGGQRLVSVFDFKIGQIIEFPLDELEKNGLTEELKLYIAGIWDQVNSGYWDYTEKPMK